MLDVPVPKKMRALTRDRRGYPVPFIILRDTDGRPHFTINDSVRHTQCITEKRCPICGTRIKGLLWFVGGPLSAFHPEGAYIDSALHEECMTYALQVCPYLAAPNYSGRLDTATLDPAKVPEEVEVFMDPTTIPARPAVFVAVASRSQVVNMAALGLRVRPTRPYESVQYWRHGQRVTDAEGEAVVKAALIHFEEGTYATKD